MLRIAQADLFFSDAVPHAYSQVLSALAKIDLHNNHAAGSGRPQIKPWHQSGCIQVEVAVRRVSHLEFHAFILSACHLIFSPLPQ